jgi:hypothetical protein
LKYIQIILTLSLVGQEEALSPFLDLRMFERLARHTPLHSRPDLLKNTTLVWRASSKSCGSTQQRAEY